METEELILGMTPEIFVIVVIIISIWSLIWKGFALWRAAKKNSLPWFIILLIFNTAGILEILYLFIFSKISYKK